MNTTGWRLLMTNDPTEPGRRPLRAMSSIAPLIGLGLLYPLRLGLLRVMPAPVSDAVVGVLMAVGVIAFSWLVFRHIDRQDRQLAAQYRELAERYAAEQQLRTRLQTVHQAALAIASAETVPMILQRLADLARDETTARYAGLAVVDAAGGPDLYFATGTDVEMRNCIEGEVRDHGVVAHVLEHGQPVRRDSLAVGEGTPSTPGAARLHRLLAVPITHAGTTTGAFYLVKAADQGQFPQEDEHLVALLANHAAVVIQQARLTAQLREMAVAAERARIRTGLHDGALQALYAVSLALDGVDEDLEERPAAAHAGIASAINGINRVMERIRAALLNLQEADARATLPEALAALLAELRAHTLVETDLQVLDEVCPPLPVAQTEAVLGVVRQVLARATREAGARRVWVTLTPEQQKIRLRIVDSGACDAGDTGAWARDANVADARADLLVQSVPGQGTAVELHIRVPRAAPVQQHAQAGAPNPRAAGNSQSRPAEAHDPAHARRRHTRQHSGRTPSRG